MNFGIRVPSKLFMLRSKWFKYFKSSKEWLISPPNLPWVPSSSRLRRLSLMTCPLLLLQTTPLHLQQSSPTQDESRSEESVRPCLNLRRTTLSVSKEAALWWSPRQQPGLRVSWKRNPEDIMTRKRSWREALLVAMFVCELLKQHTLKLYKNKRNFPKACHWTYAGRWWSCRHSMISHIGTLAIESIDSNGKIV